MLSPTNSYARFQKPMNEHAECPECMADEWHLVLDENDDIVAVQCVGCQNRVEITIHNWLH
jgi:transcription elongation factor Elf1